MGTPVAVSDLPVAELLARICSNAVSPGAGTAGAVALALAAACMGKAISITLKHRPEDSELRAALAIFQEISRAALVDGDRDADAFEDFIRENKPPALARLIREEEEFGQLISRLTAAIDEVAPKIQRNMTGDVVAGRVLLAAARQIQQRNEGETLLLR
jgi:Formiminotransferase-cyclodeaminase